VSSLTKLQGVSIACLVSFVRPLSQAEGSLDTDCSVLLPRIVSLVTAIFTVLDCILMSSMHVPVETERVLYRENESSITAHTQRLIWAGLIQQSNCRQQISVRSAWRALTALSRVNPSSARSSAPASRGTSQPTCTP